jgi:predicted nucleotidyltransferase component of viral defense system
MLTLPDVRRYSAQSGLRDIMIAEKEIVLTFLLQLLSTSGILDRLAFKGGTCLRKMFVGSKGRFSTDLDFTALEEQDHEDIILSMMETFEKEFHGIRFRIPDHSYYETVDGLSWGVNPVYSHEWNTSGDSEIRLQISRRETPTLPTERRSQSEQSYFKQLAFAPTDILCLALPEIIAEKIRASYQRNKARDAFDLSMLVTRPLDQALIRRLVVLKIWQARDSFDPAMLIGKFNDGAQFDWNDLNDLVHRDARIEPQKICHDCASGLRFLIDLSPEEQMLAVDPHQKQQALWEKLRGDLLT